MSTAKKKQDGPTVIKKYANRRLYDTGRSSYVTLDDLCIMVKEGHDFVVYDAKSGNDLTRQVLTQIIVDQEGKEGQNLLPIPFLRQLIGFYDENMDSLLPNYLEQTIDTFTKNQEQFRAQMGQPFGGIMNPVSAMEELAKKNMSMFENAMQAWSPIAGQQQEASQNGAESDTVHELKQTIAAMKKEIERLNGRA